MCGNSYTLIIKKEDGAQDFESFPRHLQDTNLKTYAQSTYRAVEGWH
jgi:hypothetical protein